MTKYILATLAPVALVAPMVQAADWGTDLPSALQQAKQSGKNVLVVFSGSDWCGPCIALKKNILDKADFKAFADQNFVLVELDFPRSKPMSAAQKAANSKYASQYKVQGFPTTLALSPDGKELARIVGGVSSVDNLKERLAAATVASGEGADCSGGVCRPPSGGASAESDLDRVKRELAALDDDNEAIYEYTVKELEREEIDRAVELTLHAYQTLAILSTATTEQEVVDVCKVVREDIIPAFEEEFPEEVKVLQELVDMLKTPEDIQQLLKENAE